MAAGGMDADVKSLHIITTPPSGRVLARSNSQIITRLFQVNPKTVQTAEHFVPDKPLIKKPLSRTDSTFVIISGRAVSVPPKAAAVIGASKEDGSDTNASFAADRTVTPKIRPPLKHKSLASFVHKHFVSMHNKFKSQGNTGDSYSNENKVMSTSNMSKSCPNLADKIVVPNPKSKVRITRSTDDAFERRQEGASQLHSNFEDIIASPKHLRVPTVFTTSQTHSIHRMENSQEAKIKGHRKEYRYSAPELRVGDVTHETELTRTFSNPSEKHIHDSGRCREENGKLYYHDAHISQILDFVYVGNMESASNERLLCKLNIEGIVDVSSASGDNSLATAAQKKSPCTCPLDKRHLRPILRINLRNTDVDGMFDLFEEINRFVEGFKKNGKRVLVYCMTGKCEAPAVVMQYLMAHRNLNVRRSFNLVKKLRPEVELTETFQTVLKRLERRLRQRGYFFLPASPTTPERDMLGACADSDMTSSSNHHRKVAWSEC